MDNIEEVAEFMKQHELLLVTAESCTAGLIAARLADIPGAGALLDCAFVVYSPQAKQHCLDVSQDTMERFNLTSEEVAREMALGAIARSRANMAIANTGVVDPTDDEIPPGTQCFAWAFQRTRAEGDAAEPIVFTETRRFSGDRNEVRQASAEYALQRIPFHFGRIDRT
nr:CinA family protein [Pseudomonas sp.]